MAEVNCKSCDILTKYRCLKCNTFACNCSLDCSVFASENLPGWTAGSHVVLCKECDDLEKWKENDEKENATHVGNHENGDCQRQEDSFVFDCALRGFYEYRRAWAPRMGHRLSVFFEKSNVFDPYIMALARKIKTTVTEIQVVGHLPREISQFYKFFCDHGGELSAAVRIRNIVDHQPPREDWRSLSLLKYLRETLLRTYLKNGGIFGKALCGT